MRRNRIESESIASIGYDADRNELEIEFRQSGYVYRYFGVSDDECAEFMSAESKGSYLNEVFKLKGHPYVRVRPGHRR